MMPGKKIKALVTGAAGFLGGHTVRTLLDMGVSVRAFVWDREDAGVLDGLDIERFIGDITKPDDCMAAARGIDTVFHIAAKVSFQPKDRAVQYAVNVQGTNNMLNAAKTQGVRRFVHVSTVNAFGYPAQGQVGDETTAFNWRDFNIGYMQTKKAAQDLVLDATRQGLDAVVCNPGTMFGPFDINMNAAGYIRGLARARGLMVCPPGGTNIADVRAVARGLSLAAQRGSQGRCYILGGLNVTYKELFFGILRLLGRNIPVVTLPGPAILAAARGCRIACGILGKTPALTPEMANGSIRRLFYSSNRAIKELNYHPGDPWQAISDTIKWLDIG